MLLALDTATRYISLALHDGNRLQFESTWYTHNNHTVELTPAIHAALSQAKLGPGDLRAVAVAQGPGSFTGLRIGMGVAKGLALAQNLDLIAVPTLEIVAAAQPPFAGTLIAVLQAGRGRICVQPFHLDGGHWIAESRAAITTWTDIASSVRGSTRFAGEIDETGQVALAALVPQPTIAPAAANLRRAGYLAEIAWEHLRAGRRDNPASVTPIYLHQPGVPHP